MATSLTTRIARVVSFQNLNESLRVGINDDISYIAFYSMYKVFCYAVKFFYFMGVIEVAFTVVRKVQARR